jgi:hypothetical protein
MQDVDGGIKDANDTYHLAVHKLTEVQDGLTSLLFGQLPTV